MSTTSGRRRPARATASSVQHLADALHHAFDPSVQGAGFAWGDLGMLAAWAAVGLAIALRRFAWAPVAAPA